MKSEICWKMLESWVSCLDMFGLRVSLLFKKPSTTVSPPGGPFCSALAGSRQITTAAQAAIANRAGNLTSFNQLKPMETSNGEPYEYQMYQQRKLDQFLQSEIGGSFNHSGTSGAFKRFQQQQQNAAMTTTRTTTTTTTTTTKNKN